MMKITNPIELGDKLDGYIDCVINDDETVFVNVDSRNCVVMIPIDEYNMLKQIEYYMSSPDTIEALKYSVVVTAREFSRIVAKLVGMLLAVMVVLHISEVQTLRVGYVTP